MTGHRKSDPQCSYYTVLVHSTGSSEAGMTFSVVSNEAKWSGPCIITQSLPLLPSLKKGSLLRPRANSREGPVGEITLDAIWLQQQVCLGNVGLFNSPQPQV